MSRSSISPSVMHVSAELEPLAKVGGLGDAVAGLSSAMEERGWDVERVVPDYGGVALAGEHRERLPAPRWAGEVWVRRGCLADGRKVALVGSDRIRRPHPYVDPMTGESWADNDIRFMAFAVGAAALADLDRPSVVHAHDWHAAGALCFVDEPQAAVLSIHNLAHQGVSDISWLERLGPRGEPMRVPGGCGPLVGAIRRAGAIVTVSPTYRSEICTTAGEGVAELLASQTDHLSGILNGLDTALWDPATDPRIPYAFDRTHLDGKSMCGRHLRQRLGMSERRGPVVAVVSRMAHQKGVDLALAVGPWVAAADGVLVIHGSGQHDVAQLVRNAADGDRDHVVVLAGYEETTAHRLLAGADLLLMPSRFEPCGLTQMQAMTYGTIPVVTGVGGLRDTVVDDDRIGGSGTGFVADRTDVTAVVDAFIRALAAYGDRTRWRGLVSRAMAGDWSWSASAASYECVYRSVMRS